MCQTRIDDKLPHVHTHAYVFKLVIGVDEGFEMLAIGLDIVDDLLSILAVGPLIVFQLVCSRSSISTYNHARPTTVPTDFECVHFTVGISGFL